MVFKESNLKPLFASSLFGFIDVFDLNITDTAKLQFGEIDAICGEASFQAVKKVIDLALAKEVDATVTGPINKKSINEAGHHFAGHTEIYAHFTNTKKYAMLLVEDKMKVIHVSTHVSLRQACDLVKKERILEVYLNSIEMGNGVYGAQEASIHWYKKDAINLSVQQSAGIAAILPNPRKYKATDSSSYINRRKAKIAKLIKYVGKLEF